MLPALNELKCGTLLSIIKMVIGLPILKPYVNSSFHKMNNLFDIRDKKSLLKVLNAR